MILKQPRPKNTANKSKKYNKNPTHNIFGGVKKPINDKEWRLKNDIKRSKLIYWLLAGHDIAFNDEGEFKQWLKSFKNCVIRPVNTRHNTDRAINKKHPNKYIARFDMAIRERVLF